MKKLTMWVAALGVAVVLSACGSSSVNGEAARTIAGQVADYSGPAGMLEAFTDIESTADLGTGTVSENGNFSFELSGAVPKSELTVVGNPEGCPDIRVSNTEAGIFLVPQLSVIANGNVTGYLAQVSSNLDDNEQLTSIVGNQRMYADRNLTISGSCTNTSVSGQEKVIYSLNLQQGWNVLSEKISLSTDGTVDSIEYTSRAVSDIEWSYLPSGSTDADGDDIVNSPNVNEIVGQVQNYAGPAGVLEAVLDEDDSTIGEGSIGSDGNFRVELEATVAGTSLSPVAEFGGDCEGLAISDREAMFGIFGLSYVLANGSTVGFLAQSDVPLTEENLSSYTLAGRMYVDRDVSVKGNCAGSSASFDLTMKKGWNPITVYFEEDETPYGSFSYESGIASNAKWYYVEQ